MQAVHDYYHSALYSTTFFLMIDRHSSAIGLQIPKNSTWKIIPIWYPPKVRKIILSIQLMGYCVCCFSSSQIDMDTVLSYQPGRYIPCIALIMMIERQGEKVPNSDLPIEVTGVHRPTKIMLQCKGQSIICGCK